MAGARGARGAEISVPDLRAAFT